MRSAWLVSFLVHAAAVGFVAGPRHAARRAEPTTAALSVRAATPAPEEPPPPPLAPPRPGAPAEPEDDLRPDAPEEIEAPEWKDEIRLPDAVVPARLATRLATPLRRVAPPPAPPEPLPAPVVPRPGRITPPQRVDAEASRLHYPARARRMGLEGRVLLRLHVSGTGAVVDATVLRSSGHEILDDAALRNAKTFRFMPARRDGTPVASELPYAIEFRLKE